MQRPILAFTLLLSVLVAGPAGPTYAQGSGSQQPAIPISPVTITATGSYADVSRSAVVGAFDQVMQELDAWPEQSSPTQVKDATFRRRLLELRMLMDYAAFSYDPNLLGTFRGLVDDAYEQVGSYQDLDVVQDLLQAPVTPELVNTRQIRMNVALASLRAPSIRSAMRAFLTSSTGAVYSLEQQDVPLLWKTAGQVPTDRLDGVGNAALLGAGTLAGIQSSNPFVADVLDPVQEAHFHDIRKATRAILLLMNMFPDTRQALVGTAEPLFALVSQYGDVNDAFVAHRLAPTLGIGQDDSAALVRSEFTKAQARQQAVVDAHSFEALIARLQQVQQQHQR